jgi:hypothetical protein
MGDPERSPEHRAGWIVNRDAMLLRNNDSCLASEEGRMAHIDVLKST